MQRHSQSQNRNKRRAILHAPERRSLLLRERDSGLELGELLVTLLMEGAEMCFTSIPG